MLPLVVVVSAATQAAEVPGSPATASVEQTHDPVRNESRSVLTIARVYTDPDPWKFRADFSLVYRWDGVERGPVKDDERIEAVLVVRSRDGGFEADDPKDLAIAADGERIHAMNSGYVIDFVDEDVERPGSIPTREGQPPRPITVVTRVHLCKETVRWGGPLGKIRKVFGGEAASSSAQISVGKRTWWIEPDQYAAIRRWLDRLAMTEAEAARAEEAEQKAAADARAAEKARLDPYRADVRAAVEKALKAAKSVPKKQYATTGEKLKWRMFDREIEAVVKKHGLDPRDVEELLKDYPEFKARNKIQ